MLRQRSEKKQSYNNHEENLQYNDNCSSLNGQTDNNMMPSSNVEWDQLRREATKLERQLEDRVSKYQMLNANNAFDTEMGYGNQKMGVGQGNDSDDSAALLSAEIERTMAALGDLNERMSAIAKRTQSSQHTLLVKRYREILYDYNADYQKASQIMEKRRESSALFSGAKMRNHDNDTATEHLLRERNAINNSMKSAGNVLSQASEIKADLRNQRASLGSTMGYLSGIAANVPGLNQVMDAIRKKRSRDDMILSGVIASCILFTLWYLFG